MSKHTNGTGEVDSMEVPTHVAKLLSHIATLKPEHMRFAVMAFGHESQTEEDTLDVCQMAIGDPANVLRCLTETTERVLKTNPEYLPSFMVTMMKMLEEVSPGKLKIMHADANTEEGRALLREYGVPFKEPTADEVVAELLRRLNPNSTKH